MTRCVTCCRTRSRRSKEMLDTHRYPAKVKTMLFATPTFWRSEGKGIMPCQKNAHGEPLGG